MLPVMSSNVLECDITPRDEYEYDRQQQFFCGKIIRVSSGPYHTKNVGFFLVW